MKKKLLSLTLINAAILLSSCASNSRYPGLYVNPVRDTTIINEDFTAPTSGKIANINFINQTDMDTEYRLISDPECFGDKVVTIYNVVDISGKGSWTEKFEAGKLLTFNIKAEKDEFNSKSSCSTTINFIPKPNIKYNVKFNVFPVDKKGIVQQCRLWVTYYETIGNKDYEKIAAASLNGYNCDQ